ncbi:MAG: lytic transglycosylase domain-containing protein [Brevundimonas sp.]|uniref:lytic transglycosylase domain-containing protein n=1 Tax=Brevundimonas sp. TaxID=1871086 RepID=UPI0025C2CF39|nr:lytic transglycosylase domain-containing protein [Brevundimonas sp.]MBX3477625.1 lytic transglycosylase domain-containing protein [Brevundimonas sp.]
MTDFRRAILAPALAILLAATAGAARADDDGPADGRPRALSSADRLSYTTAFDALRRGQLDLARASARQARDRILLGEVEFERLFHRDYAATYDELAAWLDEYADLPMAPRAYALALRRRPDGAPEPRRPSRLNLRGWDSVATPVDPMKAARIALNADDLSGAYATGVEIGDWWTAGLAAWRLGQFNDAYLAFERVASDPTEDPWVRAGAAYWTARAAGQSGRQDRIVEHLHLAARWPSTFYGQIALRQLGREPEILNRGPRPYTAGAASEPTLFRTASTPVDPTEMAGFIDQNLEARRTLALFEVGRRAEAEEALRTGLRSAAGDTARRMWTAIAEAIDPRPAGTADALKIDADRYPMPVLEPEGGFTVEQALIYAVARKETGFNPDARSGAGAYGLMQVMPGTAAELSGDRGFVTQPQRLLEPAVNMRLGQAYLNRMLQLPAFQNDLLRTVASYNAGPGPMLAALRKLGPDPDPLLLIEIIDVPQARDYVEKVVAAYWIYQRLMGRPLNTLDAIVAGQTNISIGLDYVPPPPAPVMEAASPATASGAN